MLFYEISASMTQKAKLECIQKVKAYGLHLSLWFRLRKNTNTKNTKTPINKYKDRDSSIILKMMHQCFPEALLQVTAEKEGSDFSDRERSNGMPAFDIVNNKTKANE